MPAIVTLSVISATMQSLAMSLVIAREDDSEVRHHSAFARRQNDADPVVGKLLPERSTQRRGRAQQFTAAERTLVHPVDDRGSERVPGQTANSCGSKMAAQGRSSAVAAFAQLEQLLPHRRNSDVARRKRFAEFDHRRIRKMLRPFREEAPALKRKDRSPKLVEPDRHDRSFGLPGKYLIATTQPQKRARAR